MCWCWGGKEGLAPQLLEPGTLLGRRAQGNSYHCLKEAQGVGTSSPGAALVWKQLQKRGPHLAPEDRTSLLGACKEGLGLL